MKIKVKFIGEYFPEDIKGKEIEVDVGVVVLPNGDHWHVHSEIQPFPGQEIELVESEETKVKEDNSVSFGSNLLKTMTVEFK